MPMTRRALALGAGAASAIGITAGAVASIPPLAPRLDAELLALRPRFQAALVGANASEMSNGVAAGMTDEEHNVWVSDTIEELDDVCAEIVDAPVAQTAEGRALKAAAAMHQLRFCYCDGWSGTGEKLAWSVLSELAGDAYVPPEVPERLRHNEPGRA